MTNGLCHVRPGEVRPILLVQAAVDVRLVAQVVVVARQLGDRVDVVLLELALVGGVRAAHGPIADVDAPRHTVAGGTLDRLDPPLR